MFTFLKQLRCDIHDRYVCAKFAITNRLHPDHWKQERDAVHFILFANRRIGKIVKAQADAGSPIAKRIVFYAHLAGYDSMSPYGPMFAEAFFAWLKEADNGVAIKLAALQEERDRVAARHAA